jgi:hypothetical protein
MIRVMKKLCAQPILLLRDFVKGKITAKITAGDVLDTPSGSSYTAG